MISAFVFSVELVTFLIVWGTRTVWTPSGGHLARTTNTNKTKSEWFLLGNRTFITSTVQTPLIISKVASEIKGSNLAVERTGEILTNETHRPGTLLVVSKRSTTRNRPRNEKKQWPCRLVCCRTSMQWGVIFNSFSTCSFQTEDAIKNGVTFYWWAYVPRISGSLAIILFLKDRCFLKQTKFSTVSILVDLRVRALVIWKGNQAQLFLGWLRF